MSRTPSAAGPQGTDAAASSLSAGAVLADRYEIVRPLGSGGMGSVYLARHRAMNRLCAIKVLHPSLTRDREARERFAREAQNASRISHPNVCIVHDFGTTPEGLVFLVMEYVEGRSLGAVLAERGTIPARRAIALVREIAAGLDAAHAIGIVHRDLKPDNVMVREEPGGLSVKLVDFGIAKAVRQDPGGEVTTAGVVVGTPDYMAPEQFAGDPVDLRADVYALGLVFYRMVTGTLPFRAATARESLARRLTEEPEPLSASSTTNRLPVTLEETVRRSLARDPAGRFPTAGSLAEALEAALPELTDHAPEPETVRLDAATRPFIPDHPPTRQRRSGLHRLTWGAAIGGSGLVVALLLWNAAAERRAGAGAGAGAGSDTGQLTPPPIAPTTPAGQPATQVSPPPSTTMEGGGTLRAPPAVPALPTAAEITNSETRVSARGRAEQIYGFATAPDSLRAMAAFMVASAAIEDANTTDAALRDRALEDAERWLVRAIDMNRGTRAGPERTNRAARYQTLLTTVQSMRKEPATA